MSKSYDLIGLQLKAHLLSTNKPLHDELFTVYPADIKFANVKANDHSSGVTEGTFMGDVSSVASNFVAKGLTWTPAAVKDVTGVRTIAALADLEAITENALAKDGSGQLYLVVKGEVTSASAQAALEAVIGRTFSEPAKEFTFAPSGPALGMYGDVTLSGAALSGSAKVYKAGEATAAAAPAKLSVEQPTEEGATPSEPAPASAPAPKTKTTK